MRKHLLSFGSTALVVASLLFVTGCHTPKPKADLGDNASTISTDQIANKDMNFALEGSDSGQIPGLYTIHFEYDKANLTQENRDLLAKNAAWLKGHPDETLQIEGHCDRHGSTEYNLALGERRAKTVKGYMVNLGVAGDRLSTISYGKEKMIDTAETDDADVKNRRANFRPINSPAVSPMSQR